MHQAVDSREVMYSIKQNSQSAVYFVKVGNQNMCYITHGK
jgi:hypothetical protein